MAQSKKGERETDKFKSMRDIVFIGHATPEDNEFTLWLQAKLLNEGYHCECDLSILLGGEMDFWNTIQEVLEESTKKYILVLSNHTFSKQGVLDEWEFCKGIARKLNLHDFIIPVRIDEISFTARIGLNRMNVIPFTEWGNGLKKLLLKLEADGVQKNKNTPQSIQSWFENTYTTHSGIDKTIKEVFFTNWLSLSHLPSILYLFKFQNEEQAKTLENYNVNYPVIRHGNFLISFNSKLTTFAVNENFEIPYIHKDTLNISQLMENYQHHGFPSYTDFRNFVIRLLRKMFNTFLLNRGLSTYEYSGNSVCYYWSRINNTSLKNRFNLNGKSKHIGVHGKHLSYYWHYGISFLPSLSPEIAFSLKSHIVFTEDGQKVVASKEKQHSLRRGKGKRMFNKEWRDQLLAFCASLTDNENLESFILVPNEFERITVNMYPITVNANFGYIEPNDESRIIPLDDRFEDEEDNETISE